jgi:hypothetical protein
MCAPFPFGSSATAAGSTISASWISPDSAARTGMPCPVATAADAEARSCSRRYSAEVGTHGSSRFAAVLYHMDLPWNSGWSGPASRRFHGLYLSSGFHPPDARAAYTSLRLSSTGRDHSPVRNLSSLYTQ